MRPDEVVAHGHEYRPAFSATAFNAAPNAAVSSVTPSPFAPKSITVTGDGCSAKQAEQARADASANSSFSHQTRQ